MVENPVPNSVCEEFEEKQNPTVWHTCSNCADWCGRCCSENRSRRFNFNLTASSVACSEFKPRKLKEQA
jgi:hypothetical protein